MITPIGEYYIYRHIRLDKDEPFYIGLGTKSKNRVSMKKEYDRAFAKSGRSDIWAKIARKTPYKVEILLESDDYEFIKQKEIELVALYGRINKNTGILANLTDGGEGTKGHIKSPETCSKISKKASKRKGALNPASVPIIHTLTLEVFECIKYAAEKYNIRSSSLSRYLSGKVNPTYFVYLRDYVEGQIHHPDKLRGDGEKIIDKDTGGIFNNPKEAALFYNTNVRRIKSILAGKSKFLNLAYLDESLRPNPYEILNGKGGKLVLDQQTGVFYYTAREAAKAFNMNHKNLIPMLNGKNRNKTSLIYV